MGGIGSTRWNGYNSKTTVEECRVLPISAFTRWGIVAEGIRIRGRLSWLDLRSGKTEASLTFEVETCDSDDPGIWLFYALPDQGKKVGYRIRLDTTPCNFGGARWWFRCPSCGSEKQDGNRRGKLYLPLTNTRYLCRACHDLTYRSCQQADNPGKLERMIAERTGYEAAQIKRALDGSRYRGNTQIVISTGS